MDDVVYQCARIERAYLAMLNRRSDARGLLHLAGHGAALLVSGTILSRAIGTWGIVPATVLHGVVLVFLFAPLHETIHRTAFKSRWLNDGLAWLFGLILVLPPD